MLGNYQNSTFHKEALICDLDAQGAKLVILQEDLQKPLVTSATSQTWVLDSCVWQSGAVKPSF